MKRTYQIFTTISVIISLLLGLVGLASPVSADNGERTNPDYERLIVKFWPGTSPSDMALVQEQLGGRVEAVIPGIGALVLSVPRQQSFSRLQSYQSDKLICYAELDGVAQAVYVPNDLYFDQSYQSGMFQIKACEAWDITRGSSSIRIAILDTGIDKDHPDLAGKVVANTNFTDSSSPYAKGNSHGTHVAGIAASETDNGIGVAGLGYNSSLMNVKVIGDDGYGLYSWVAMGIIWAADNGANVINLSLGGSTPSSTLNEAVDYAWSKGVVVVAAAGNDGNSSPFYPAYYTNCIAVGATDPGDSLYPWSNHGDWVDVAAPGTAYSTMPDGGYGYKSGTSIASPFVAGLAGLILPLATDTNRDGRLNNEVRAMIEASCDHVGVDVAYGRINAFRAVEGSSPPPTGEISGAVTNADTCNSVGGATVSDGTRSAITDSNGSYCITNVPPGSYTVAASANGYESSSKEVTVADGQTGVVDFSLKPESAPQISLTTSSLPDGEVDIAYSQTLTASGGTGSYSWSISDGALPGGLALNTATGEISGTPTTEGTSDFTVQVTNDLGGTDTQALSIKVWSLLQITTTSLPDGDVGVEYSQTLEASGGTGTYTWSISGSLPSGLSLNPTTGEISGTPTTEGTSDFTVQVSDGIVTATRGLSIKIWASPLAITTTSLADGEVDVAYSQALVATGGNGTYTWSISAGALSTDLTLDASTGLISGTPTAGTSSFTVRVQSGSQIAEKGLSITITCSVSTSVPGGHGTATASPTTVNYGGSSTVTLSPDTGYHLSAITDNGEDVLSQVTGNTYTVSNITGNHSVVVTFAINTCTIAATAGANGSITPSGAVTVNYGGSQSFTITPNTSYHIANVLVDGSSVGAVTSYTFTKVTANHTIAATFAITGRTITVTSPNGGENRAVGTSQTITWSSAGVTGNVRIQLSRNGGASWTTIISRTPNDGRQAWKVTRPATTQAKIRVVSISAPAISDTSNANFAITGRTITVISPNGGKGWVVGSTQTITWSSAGVTGNVRIQLSRNGGTRWTTIISNTPNDGSQAWKVTGLATTRARIRVVTISTPTISDTSNANFTIASP